MAPYTDSYIRGLITTKPNERGEHSLEPRNILLVGVWAFAIILLVGMLLVKGDFLVVLMVFFIAIAISVGVVVMPTGKP